MDPILYTPKWLSAQLGLKHLTSEIDKAIESCSRGNISIRDMIVGLFTAEYERRQAENQKKRIRTAGFSNLRYLEELNRAELPAGVSQILSELETLDFIGHKRNILLYGNPGTGKTHIATALGIKACMEGMSVLFSSVPHLITQLKEYKSSRTLHAYESRFKKYDLVICDEFGYVSCNKEAGELLSTCCR